MHALRHQHARSAGGLVEFADVVGMDVLKSKSSSVDAAGGLRLVPIDGLRVRAARPVPHEDGTLAEIVRADWPEVDDAVVQVHLTTTYPGRTRAWGLHQQSTDRLFVVKGLVSIVVFDGRTDSPTFGCVERVQGQRTQSGPARHPAEPLPRLEEHRRGRGVHPQHAHRPLQVRRTRCPRPAVRLRRGTWRSCPSAGDGRAAGPTGSSCHRHRPDPRPRRHHRHRARQRARAIGRGHRGRRDS